MKNIVWAKPDGSVVFTSVIADIDSFEHASSLKSSCGVPKDWNAVAFDIQITADQEASGGALRWVDGALEIDSSASLAAAWRQTQKAAMSELEASDLVALRCFKAGIKFPAAWKTYVSQLRAIVSAYGGDSSQPLPDRPDLPDGI